MQKNEKLNGRRNALKGLVTGALALSSVSAFAETKVHKMPKKSAEKCEPREDKSLPCYGKHQQGVITNDNKLATLVAFDCVARDKKALKEMLEMITQRIEFLTQGGKQPQFKSKNFPPPNSGILGGYVYPELLNINVSFGVDMFDDRYGFKKLKPKYLQVMPESPNDAQKEEYTGGDVMIQVCAETYENVVYAIRDIVKYTTPWLVPKWKQDGFLPFRDIDCKKTAINLFGFKDGTGNASNKDEKLMDKLIWVTKDNNEPKWALGGTYMVVRLIRFEVEFWDRTPLGEQEIDFGRKKTSGAPLDKKHEFDDPNMKDKKYAEVYKDSHMGRAEPRDPVRHVATLRRRSFSYSNGLAKNGHMDMGLIFICFQANLQTGFIDTQKRLDGEPLEEYIKPYGGGFYYTLPGVKKGEYLGKSLLEAV